MNLNIILLYSRDISKNTLAGICFVYMSLTVMEVASAFFSSPLVMQSQIDPEGFWWRIQSNSVKFHGDRLLGLIEWYRMYGQVQSQKTTEIS